MPIPLETTPLTPNSLMVPQIIISTCVRDGKLVIGAHITMSAAYVDNQGNWTPTGQANTVVIEDIEHLDEDIAGLAPTVMAVMGGIITLVATLNSIRKVL